MQIHTNAANYGEGDATYQAVGGLDGIRKLVTEFYRVMDENPDYKTIRDMHPDDLTESIDKLTTFLSGWMGGEPLYLQKYGGGGMPQKHSHLHIDEAKRDMWLACMCEALNVQDFPQGLVDYLLVQLAFPAQRIYETSRREE